MDHFTANFSPERRAILSIDFTKGKLTLILTQVCLFFNLFLYSSFSVIVDGDDNEEDDDDDEEELEGTVNPETQSSSVATPALEQQIQTPVLNPPPMAALGATPIPSPQRQTPVPTSPPMAADSTQMSAKPSQSVNTNAAENTPLFTPTSDVSHNSSTDAPAQVKFCVL